MTGPGTNGPGPGRGGCGGDVCGGDGSVGAIVLTGGRASRLGGIDKGSVAVAGRPMVEAVLGAARAVAGPVRTVGPGGDTREDPPFSGPVAGIAAGLRTLPESVDLVVVVACDLPDLDAATLRDLLDALRPHPASHRPGAALAVDAAGRDQYLLAAWDRRALTSRVTALERSGGVGGRAVRALYDGEDVVRVPVGSAARDVDTWADVAGRGPIGLPHVGAVLRSALTPSPADGRPPLAAVGGVLTSALIAVDPMPREPVSAMDGYALAGRGPWRLTGTSRRAGDDSPASLVPGSAAPIATGALAPAGCDRVLRHELVTVTRAAAGPDVVTASPDAAGVNDLRPVGEDWPVGHQLAAAGTVLDAALASAALSAGVTEIPVRGPIRASLITTGDEVLPAEAPSPLPPGRIRDTVGPVLGAVLTRAGFGSVGPPGHCPDTADAVGALLKDGPGDVLVLVGATGGGVADLLRPALARAGARVVLDGVRVRPGGSQLVAVLADGRVLLGLPGNPLAAVSAAATTGRALVDALTGRQRTPTVAHLNGLDDLAAPGRTRILPARPDGAGGWTITPRLRTAHLADLAGAPVLALVPDTAPADGAVDEPVELIEWI
ncbi:NTP transferase domain-containing protein [Dietzia sp. ANT_WB102]|uniref:NTP transferase domain-containing protein n=1 Tax=Dietzia sp. ANT_WB102 TaxID=2597345 RepID=UPI0021065036|nr:NTP transferase domain-containing protein [Dietzia sp. ANT_WB102]